MMKFGLFSLLCMLSMLAQAEVVTYRASGQINYGSGLLLDDHVIELGDSFEVEFSWETTTPADSPGNNSYANYRAITYMALSIGDSPVFALSAEDQRFPLHDVTVTNYDLSGDGYEFLFFYAGSPGLPSIYQDYSLTSATISFYDQFVNSITSSALPNRLNLNDFTDTRFQVQFDSATDLALFSGHITELTAVPLPGAVWLFFSGLLGLGIMSRRKRTH